MFVPMLITSLVLLGQSCAATIAAVNSKCKPNSWQNLTSVPHPRQEHGTVALDDTTIAVLGGMDPHRSGFFATDLLELYDIPSNTWRGGAPAPFKVHHPNIAAVHGKLYLLGGLVDKPIPPGGTLNSGAHAQCAVYDPAKDTWSKLESMPHGTERGSAITGVHGEMIYLAGGMTVLDGYQDSLTMVTAFNTTSGHWQRMPPKAAAIPAGRQHAVGAVIDDKFYVVGGRWFSQEAVRGTVFALDLKHPAAGWRTMHNRMPHPRGGISGGVVGSKIYTFGGEGDPDTVTGVFPQSEAFDTVTRKWSELRHMAVPRHGTYAVAIGNKIYIPGGGLQQDGEPVESNGTITIQNPTNHFDAYCVWAAR